MRKRFEISSRRVEAMENEYAPLPGGLLSSPVKCLTKFSFNRLQELRQRPVDLATLKANLKGECNALHGEMFKRFADMNAMFKVYKRYKRMEYGRYYFAVSVLDCGLCRPTSLARRSASSASGHWAFIRRSSDFSRTTPALNNRRS